MKAQQTKPQKRDIESVLLYSAGNIASFINFLIPKKNMITMRSFPDFADNTKAFFDYLIEYQQLDLFQGYEIVWHVSDPKSAEVSFSKPKKNKYKIRFVKKGSIASLFAFFRSKYIISTHGFYAMIKLTDSQKSFLFWHGMILKKIGFLYDNDIKNGVNQADYYFVTSEMFSSVFQKVFNAPSNRILITGQPRNDLLFKKDNKIIDYLNTGNNKLIVYLPTYRKSNNKNKDNGISLNENGQIFGGTLEQWQNLNKLLIENGYVIVIKPHPMEQKIKTDVINDLENIRIIDEDWLNFNRVSLYNILAVSEKLITDYSSVYIDYLLLNKPICFFHPDFYEYNDSRGFIVDNIVDYMPGSIIKDFSEIENFIISEDKYSEKRQEINNIFNDIKNDSACENTAIAIKEIIEINEM